MKRFYKQVSVEPVAGGHAIRLDGRAVKTPARADLALPTSALAHAVAAEWDAQREDIDPRSMPLTGLANAAIDRVAPDPAAFAQGLAAYAETDLLCYRADSPAELVARQAGAWDPLLAWAGRRYDVRFETVAGIVHRAQPDETVRRLSAAVAAYGAFHLAALQPLVTIAGSLVIALAIAEGRIDVEQAFATAHLDELWQVERWGEDELATRAREHHRADFKAAARFLALLV
ncbi:MULTISPECIES: ATP12 family chaperone protein [unclassified Sphingomonas]|uniref:ATP12 family chaperone protein n=1 Tax=unclassified Sphingomonas TaxID=196159 RepID=UPI0006FFD79F|nr:MULTISPECIES: ATP12 family protein [unclassified Sphingomonas]KQX25340.1 ATPase [Sphingomonas sp. Root1294]KQY66333.1 ATPase [Sphingomonas sp. Root50]KRB90355.1 ATPase [Sphingomonas sp. Root720]